MRKYTVLLIAALTAYVMAKSKPTYIGIKNSYGYDSLYIYNDTIRVDTTGAQAWKKVLTDTSSSVDVDRITGIVYSYRLYSDSTNTDSMIYTESIACYDDGLDQWLYPGDYIELDSPDSVLTPDSTGSSYGRIEIDVEKCDKIKFITSVPANCGHDDTVYIPSRYLRLEN